MQIKVTRLRTKQMSRASEYRVETHGKPYAREYAFPRCLDDQNVNNAVPQSLPSTTDMFVDLLAYFD